MAAGTRDDVDAASSGNLLHHTDVAAQVESGGVDNGPDPFVIGLLQRNHGVLYSALTVEKFGVRLAHSSGTRGNDRARQSPLARSFLPGRWQT